MERAAASPVSAPAVCAWTTIVATAPAVESAKPATSRDLLETASQSPGRRMADEPRAPPTAPAAGGLAMEPPLRSAPTLPEPPSAGLRAAPPGRARWLRAAGDRGPAQTRTLS